MWGGLSYVDNEMRKGKRNLAGQLGKAKRICEIRFIR
jgi:hypothetical protein